MDDIDDKEESSPEDLDKNTEKPWWSELMKEVTLTGLATVFMTEDSIRNYLKEKKLPKELVGLFLEGVTKKKDDVYGRFAKEFSKILTKIDVSKEVGKFLEEHDVQLNAKISFEKKEGKES